MGRILNEVPQRNIFFNEHLCPFSAHFAIFSKQQRQDTLSMQYRFDCKCEGCELDYPTFSRMSHKTSVPLVTDDPDMKLLGAYNYDFAVSNYRKYCDFLTQYGDAYPCKQISSAEECLKMALHIMVDAVPLKAKM